MSHDTNTIDSRTHEGQLNKLGFWIFLTAEFALFGTLFAALLTLQHGVFQFTTYVKKKKVK